ncbi:MAG: 3-phosphoshikimate 1-carboxyvinyltransferase [Lachnospirales bacterium]
MDVIIYKSELKGSIKIPPSKSLSHRGIICAAMAEGTSNITNLVYSKDIKATIAAMKSLGSTVEEKESSVIVKGCKPHLVNKEIFCNESGSTVRFLIPIALTTGEKVTFTGANHLVNRPLDAYYEIFKKNNVAYKTPEGAFLPMILEGNLKPIDVDIIGNVSSQFISGLMFAYSNFKADTKINITTKLESKGYIDLTIDILNKFGIEIINNNYESFVVRGGTLSPYNYEVEGDFSQVAFYELAGKLHGNIEINGLNLQSKQGDMEILKIGEKLGIKHTYGEKSIKYHISETKAIEVDLSETPDLGPAVFSICALSKGKSIIRGVERLRIKECERVEAMVEAINLLGGSATDHGEYVEINGVENLEGGVNLNGYNDHRIVMALSVLGSVCHKPITISHAEAINKSYPNFFDDLKALGGIFELLK